MERQKAYRDRHAAPREDTLAALARTLHAAVTDAAKSGDLTAQAVAASRADETLKNLIRHFKDR